MSQVFKLRKCCWHMLVGLGRSPVSVLSHLATDNAPLPQRGWSLPISSAGHRGCHRCTPRAPTGRPIPPCGARPTAWASRSRLSVFRKPRRGALSNASRAAETSCSHPATRSRPCSASRKGGPWDRPRRESDAVILQCQVLACFQPRTLTPENVETNSKFYCKEKA